MLHKQNNNSGRLSNGSGIVEGMLRESNVTFAQTRASQ